MKINCTPKQLEWVKKIVETLRARQTAGSKYAETRIAKLAERGNFPRMEKAKKDLSDWNTEWELFWETCDRCNFNASFWIDGFKNTSAETLNISRRGARETWIGPMMAAGVNAEKSADMRTFIPVARVTEI